MISKNTIENNLTKENLKLLDAMAWKSEWNGEYFEKVRGFDNYFNEAEMIIEELKKRKIKVELYEALWKIEAEIIKLRSSNHKEYEKKRKSQEFLKTGREWKTQLEIYSKGKAKLDEPSSKGEPTM